MTNDIEDALRKAVWALNNIEDQLKDIVPQAHDYPTKWAVENCNANIRLIRGDVEEALTYLRLNRRQRFMKKLRRK